MDEKLKEFVWNYTFGDRAKFKIDTWAEKLLFESNSDFALAVAALTERRVLEELKETLCRCIEKNGKCWTCESIDQRLAEIEKGEKDA